MRPSKLGNQVVVKIFQVELISTLFGTGNVLSVDLNILETQFTLVRFFRLFFKRFAFKQRD